MGMGKNKQNEAKNGSFQNGGEVNLKVTILRSLNTGFVDTYIWNMQKCRRLFLKLNQQFYSMRARYFSPHLRETLEGCKSKPHHQLRWVGSQVRLTRPIQIDQQCEHTIGGYKYNSNREIGSGYSSKVYKASKPNDPTEYAIKVIDLRKYSSSNLDMLTNEIDILKQLNHPNVLKCYDVFRTPTQCFIVTEYCGNGDLLTHITKKGRFNQQEALSIMSDVVNGYKYLCEHSVIHRDLKPANIIKSNNMWKIADFGFACKSGPAGEVKSKYNVGTPLYMPPQALIDNLYSIKSDIFSMGIILYEMVIGCTPWESRTEKDLIQKMSAIPFRIPDKFHISDSLRALLEKMCSIRISKRMDRNELFSLEMSSFLQVNETVENPEEINLLRKEKSLDFLREKLGKRLPIMQTHLQIKPLAIHKQPMVLNNNSKSIKDAQEDAQLRKMQRQNNEILICQLHYCRFLYYLVKNMGCACLEKKLCQKMGVIVFTHLLRLVKMIGETENHLRLKEWDRFKKSKKYLNTSLTIKEYCNRYDKEFSIYLTSIDLDVLEQVNAMFPQIGFSSIFSLQFYSTVIRFIGPLIKAMTNNIAGLLLQDEAQLSREKVGAVEALRSLYKYYRLVQMSITHFQDFLYFQKHCSIKVNIDFKKSDADFNTYQALRKEIKNL